MQSNDMSVEESAQERQAIEVWRPVKEYEGIYEVSSYGRVRSIDREDSAGRKRKGKILSPSSNHGYLGVNLGKNGKLNFIPVAYLVAQAFLGERPAGYQVHHRDAIKHNNRIENLEYVTGKRNIEFASEAEHMGKLSRADVRAIHSAYRDGVSTSELARTYGVRASTIGDALSGKTYASYYAADETLIPVKLQGKRKVSDDTVREIREKYKSGIHSCYTLAKEYGLHPTTINKLVLEIRRPNVT